MLDSPRGDPFQDIVSLRDAMNRLMGESFLLPSRIFGATAPETDQITRATRMIGAPSIDIMDQGDTFVVRATLPGVRPEDVRIEARDNQVTLSGQVREEQNIEQANYILRERRAGQFSRTFTLPTDANPTAAEAIYENGILTLRLPKTEAARARQIPNRTAGQLNSGQVQAPGQGQGQSQMPGQCQSQPQR